MAEEQKAAAVDELDLDDVDEPIDASTTSKQNTKGQINTHEHPNFGRGRHRVNNRAVNHEFRRELWGG